MCHFPAIYLQCAIPEIDAALLAAKDVRPWAVQRSLLQELSFPKLFPETHPQNLPPSERFIDWCFRGQSVRRGSSFPPPLASALHRGEEISFSCQTISWYSSIADWTGQLMQNKAQFWLIHWFDLVWFLTTDYAAALSSSLVLWHNTCPAWRKVHYKSTV